MCLQQWNPFEKLFGVSLASVAALLKTNLIYTKTNWLVTLRCGNSVYCRSPLGVDFIPLIRILQSEKIKC